jgi:hypothetical protein
LQLEGTGVDNVVASVQPPILDGSSPINPNNKIVTPPIPSGDTGEGNSVENIAVSVQPQIVDETSPINPNTNDVAPDPFWF